ncbi:MAG: DUF1351 domain-containing protein [Desulfovibrionaceae bacterium]|nr:DUF1351 domain-containing protein [Desulfovibrionaceae bacterium]
MTNTVEIIPRLDNEAKDITIVKWNEEELFNQIELAMQSFDIQEASEETIKELKKQRATLNKGLSALKDFEKSVREFVLQDYNENFLPKFKKIRALVEEKQALSDTNIKEFEQALREIKTVEIKAVYAEIFTEELALIAPFEKIFKAEWLQAGYKVKNKIEKENSNSIYGIMKQIKENIEKGLQTLENMNLKYPDISKEAFLKNYSIQEAMDANIAYERLQEQLQKQEIERKRKEAEQAQPQAVVTPTPPAPTPVEPAPAPAEEEKFLVTIQFSCTMAQGKLIKNFFNSLGIEYKNIKLGENNE